MIVGSTPEEFTQAFHAKLKRWWDQGGLAPHRKPAP